MNGNLQQYEAHKTEDKMKKQPTERQIWAIWNREYKLWNRAGFSINEAVRRADARAAEKRAQPQAEPPTADA